MEVAKYLLGRRGVLAQAAFDLGAFVRSHPGAKRPDAELLLGTYSVDYQTPGAKVDRDSGIQIVGFGLRNETRGELFIRSTDAAQSPRILPNYLATESDQRTAVGIARVVRRLVQQPPLAAMVIGELNPGPEFGTDEQILDAWRRQAICGYHLIGTCAMGTGAQAVTDPQLRVRGVEGLRIMDASVLPIIPSGNINGPIMAMAARAADLITASP
jgi:choline dehydrogenase-like flavoprotein